MAAYRLHHDSRNQKLYMDYVGEVIKGRFHVGDWIAVIGAWWPTTLNKDGLQAVAKLNAMRGEHGDLHLCYNCGGLKRVEIPQGERKYKILPCPVCEAKGIIQSHVQTNLFEAEAGTAK